MIWPQQGTKSCLIWLKGTCPSSWIQKRCLSTKRCVHKMMSFSRSKSMRMKWSTKCTSPSPGWLWAKSLRISERESHSLGFTTKWTISRRINWWSRSLSIRSSWRESWGRRFQNRSRGKESWGRSFKSRYRIWLVGLDSWRKRRRSENQIYEVVTDRGFIHNILLASIELRYNIIIIIICI